MDLSGFFRSLSPELVAQYRARYLGEAAPVGELPADDPETADRLAAKFADRHWVRGELRDLERTHHAALIALLHCQGVAGGTWLLQELTQAHGMGEDVWAEVLHDLGGRLWVFGNSRQSPPLFYMVPEAIEVELAHQFKKRLGLTAAASPDIRLSKDTNYRYPVSFSVIAFLAYLRQHRVRMTRKDEIFKKNHDELLAFFGNLWGGPDQQAVLAFHLDLATELGLVQQRAGFLEADDAAVDEFLGMRPEHRRALLLHYFVRREPLLRWLLDRLDEVEADGWASVPNLRMLYRRRYMGSVFHRRYVRKSYYLPPSGFYDPSPPLELLQVAGVLESGLGPEGSYVRLSDMGRALVTGKGWSECEANPSVRFLVQPTFDLLAPVGLPLDALWRLAQVGDLRAADRATTLSLTRESVRRALDDGWRLTDLLGFLASGSMTPVPQNVSSTLDSWAGRHGEIELHDTLVATCSPDRADAVRAALDAQGIRYEALSPSVFAIARERQHEALEAFRAAMLDPAPKVRTHDCSARGPDRGGALQALLDAPVEDPPPQEDGAFPLRSLVTLGAPAPEGGKEAMEARGSRSGRIGANRVGADLSVKPAAAGAGDLLRLSPGKTIAVVRAAIRLGLDVEVLYPSTADDDPGGLSRVTPSNVEEQGGSSFFLGRHHRLEREMQFHIKRIQGIRLAT